jgi:hypothetical protein
MSTSGSSHHAPQLITTSKRRPLRSVATCLWPGWGCPPSSQPR